MISALKLLKLINNFSKKKSQDTKSMCENHKHFYMPITDRETNHDRTPIHNYKRIKYKGIHEGHEYMNT